MFGRQIQAFLAALAIGATVVTVQGASPPRKAPPLTIMRPSGEETRLSSFKGKVVAIEFLFVRSPRCLQLAGMLNKLEAELGQQGFQAVAVAFGPGASPGTLAHMVEYFKLTYAVGYTTADEVDAYLGREGKQVLKIPQVVVVDRSGAIRATSGPQGDSSLESESGLRGLVQRLLPERGSTATAVSPGGVEYPQAAPNFVLRDASGSVVRLEDYRGKVVLLDFWATWCEPCKAEIPWLNDLGKRYEKEGFAVLGVALEESRWKIVKRYAARENIGYRILLGGEQMAGEFGGISALPEKMLIDREGRIVSRHAGVSGRMAWEREIGQLLRTGVGD